MTDSEMAATGVDDDLKRKLVLRVFFAGMMIVVLLGALAFIDSLGSRPDEPMTAGPVYSEPVPVPKKEISQPVKPAESSGVSSAAPDSPPGSTATAAQSVPPDPPAPPAVATQPVLPRQEAAATASATRPAVRAPVVATPAEGTSAASIPLPPAVPERAPSIVSTPVGASAAAPPPAIAPASAERPSSAPPRLLSGYAVQAGVFSDAQRAEELRARLTLNGIPSSLEARVQVGPFKTREEALAAQEKLKALGIEGVVLPPRGGRR